MLPPLRQASLKWSQAWVWNVLWFQSEFRLRWVQRAVVHVLLKEHCMHMAEDLAATGARARSLNEKTYKPALATIERILPASSLSSSSPATRATYPVQTSK